MKVTIIKLLFLVATLTSNNLAAIAQECNPQELEQTTPDTKTESGYFVRAGLYINWIEPSSQSETSDQLIDSDKAEEQRCSGCNGSAIRFGDSAAMRDSAPSIDWSEDIRKNMAAASLTDVSAQAYGLYEQILEFDTLSTNQRTIVENLYLTTSLQFSDFEKARESLIRFSDFEDAAPALRADRLFIEAMLLISQKTNNVDWRNNIDPLLSNAVALDPSFFSARSLRAISWIKGFDVDRAVDVEGNRNCVEIVRSIGDRLLDVSEAGSCPLMVGHFSHYSARLLSNFEQNTGRPTQVELWRAYEGAVLGFVTQNRNAITDAKFKVSNMQNLICASEIASAITELEAL